jgi:hypothetical protein
VRRCKTLGLTVPNSSALTASAAWHGVYGAWCSCILPLQLQALEWVPGLWRIGYSSLLCALRHAVTTHGRYVLPPRLALGHYVVQLAKGIVEALPGAFELPDAAATVAGQQQQQRQPVVHAQAVSSERQSSQARYAALRRFASEDIRASLDSTAQSASRCHLFGKSVPQGRTAVSSSAPVP